jgi:hypothetical protein
MPTSASLPFVPDIGFLITSVRLDIVGSPVQLHSSSAIGAFVPGSIKFMFDKIGMKPKKWF